LFGISFQINFYKILGINSSFTSSFDIFDEESDDSFSESEFSSKISVSPSAPSCSRIGLIGTG